MLPQESRLVKPGSFWTKDWPRMAGLLHSLRAAEHPYTQGPLVNETKSFTWKTCCRVRGVLRSDTLAIGRILIINTVLEATKNTRMPIILFLL